MLGFILLFTFLASILSLILVGVLLLHKTLVKKISFSLVSFGAGALLGVGFLDTFPEAVGKGGNQVFLWVTFAFVFFFIVERLFIFLHHHDDGDERVRIPASFLLFGDALHNFVDGMSIAATFLVSFPLGVVTSITVFVHEIPHELGDFGILIHKGWGRGKVFWFNALTGLVAIFGAVLTYFVGKQSESVIPVLLAIVTGNFIYLSATDLLPEIHHREKKGFALVHVMFFLLGIILIILLTQFLKG
ncbi:MAG: ZIP family metal transporter [Patescibacteria group bacterium]|nr:ZIP family metal transporter [Patescibacteria group bacterium]